MSNIYIKNVDENINEVKLKKVLIIQLISIILTFVSFILSIILSITNIIPEVIGFLVPYGIPLEILLFEIYLYYIVVVKKKNVIIEDVIQLPIYESIYLILMILGENLVATLYNNSTGAFLGGEAPTDTLLYYIIMILYYILLNLYYYSENSKSRLIYFLFTQLALIEAIFHLYHILFVNTNNIVDYIYAFPFLPLTMLVITVRLYIIRKTCKIEFDNGLTYFRF